MTKGGIKFVPTQTVRGFSVNRLSGDEGIGRMTDTLFKAAKSVAFSVMRQTASYLADDMSYMHQSGGMHFKDVTGNLYASMGISLVGQSVKYDRPFALKFVPASRDGWDKKVTRESLTKGEAYDKDRYADGTAVNNPYKGERDSNGTKGKTERDEYFEKLKQLSHSGKHLYNIVVFASMPYASYVDIKDGRAYFREIIAMLRDEYVNAVHDYRIGALGDEAEYINNNGSSE